MTALNAGEPPATSPDPAARRGWIAFAVVAAVLLVAGIGFNAVVAKMQVTFRKLPVDPAAPLLSISATAGPWAQASVDRSFNSDFEHALGTKDYVNRQYINTAKLSEADRKKFLAANLEQREQLLRRGEVTVPKDASILFMLTYYTGSVDTVPHVPERCYAADGYKPTHFEIANWAVLPRVVPEQCRTDVRLMAFEDQIDSRASRPRQVSYFFQVNGTYEQDPIFGVRKKLQNLLEPYAYFAKIEVVTDLPTPDDAPKVMSDFLSHLMPEVERVLPDWKKVTSQGESKSAEKTSEKTESKAAGSAGGPTAEPSALASSN